MSNTAFPLGMQALLSAGINFVADTISAVLVPSTYTYSDGTQYASALGTLIGTPQPLLNKSVVGGILDADDLAFGTIASGSTIKAVAIIKNTGNLSTSPVLFYFDTAAGLPVATTGGEFTLPWNDDVKKIARLNLPFFPLGGQKTLSAGINFLTDNIKVRLMPDTYVYDEDHEFINQVGSGVGTDQALTGKSVTNGIFNADPAAFGTIAGGSTLGSLILYKDTGTPSTSPVLLHYDDVVGFPKATNGAPYTQKWSTGTAKIFKLTAA